MIMIRREDNRFKPQKFSTMSLVRAYLESQGWSIFSTDYDYDNRMWIVNCEYVKDDNNYDKTTSYTIEVEFSRGFDPNITIHPPIMR